MMVDSGQFAEAQQELTKYGESFEATSDMQQKYFKMSDKGWAAISAGIAVAGGALLAWGKSLEKSGGASAKWGKALQALGTALTVFGTIMSVVIPLKA